MILWRVSNYADLRGVGGIKRAGRWHSKGRPVVYLAEHPALALLETLVHLEIDSVDDLPDTYRLLKVEIEDPTSLALLDGLPEDETTSKQIGDDWLASGNELLLRVSSVLVPESFNYLFNPVHQDAKKATIVANHVWPFDPRLVKGV